MEQPTHLDLKRDRGLTIQWADGTTSYFTIPYLRRMSPSAEQRELREQMERNPLAVLPASSASDEPVTALSAELVGNYALRIRFSDGHDTGIYSWAYLRSIDPASPTPTDPQQDDPRLDDPRLPDKDHPPGPGASAQ